MSENLLERWQSSDGTHALIDYSSAFEAYVLSMRKSCSSVQQLQWHFPSYIDAYMTMERFGDDWRKVR